MKDKKITDVYLWNLEAFNDKTSLIVNQGGQGSSKTISILQVLLDIWNTLSDLRITVASYALPHLKAGAIHDIQNILRTMGMEPIELFTGMNSLPVLTHPKNGSFIEFVGVEGNEARATGPRRDILYVNEANKRIKYDVFELMNARTHMCTFIDFNPSARFWFHDIIQPNFDHVLIKSTFENNPYLPEREREIILSKRDKPGFENWWKVYGEGELGILEGAVFTNWRYEFEGEVQQAFNELGHGFGLDYGFYPDPDAMDKIAIDNKRKIIYVKECVHENNQGTDDLVKELRRHVKGPDLIVAESASPRTNKDLRKKGFNIHSISKTKTVDEWLREMQNYEFVLSEDSINTAKEFENYIWNDKKAGIPIDAWNHHIDEIRYYYMYQNMKAKKSKIKSFKAS